MRPKIYGNIRDIIEDSVFDPSVTNPDDIRKRKVLVSFKISQAI